MKIKSNYIGRGRKLDKPNIFDKIKIKKQNTKLDTKHLEIKNIEINEPID